MRLRLLLLDAGEGRMERGRELNIVVVVVVVVCDGIIVALNLIPPLHDTAEALIVQAPFPPLDG